MSRRHRLTSYIEVLDLKANDFNKYAICLACLEIKGRPYALEKQFTNTKKCCKDHFKKCEFFQQKYGVNEAQAIIDDTDSEATMQKRQGKRFHIQKDDNNRLSNYTSSSVSVNTQGLLDNFAHRQFTGCNLAKFNYLLLKATISNGWSFCWVQNPDTIALFEFINPSCKLPGRRKLGGKILTCVSNQMVANINEKAQKDFYGVTLTMDGWTNIINQSIIGSVLLTSSGEVLVWQAIDISGEREEVKNKINEITKSVTNEGIKVAAIVTDSHSSYAAARKQLQTLIARYEPQTNEEIEIENNLILPNYICNPINNFEFWQNIVAIKRLLLSYCGCLNILQRDKARLYDVLHSFAHRNHKLEQIKQLYYSNATTTLYETDEDTTQEPEELTNIIEQEQETDSENELQDFADLTKNNLEKVLSLWESMLEDEKLYDWNEEITDSLLNAELSYDILLDHEHPQRDKHAKWIL
ncbi:19705_t:CDS:2, partial [Racocetra fulgida]